VIKRCCCNGGNDGDPTLSECVAPSEGLGATEYYRCDLPVVVTDGTFFGTGRNPPFTAWSNYCSDYSSGCTAGDFRWRVDKYYGPPCGAAADLCTDLLTPAGTEVNTGSAWYERRPNTFDAYSNSYVVEIEAMTSCQLLDCAGVSGNAKAYSVVDVVYRWSNTADFKLSCYPDPTTTTETATASHFWSCKYVRGYTGTTWMEQGAYWLRSVTWGSANANRGYQSNSQLCAAGSGSACRDSRWQPNPAKQVDTQWTPPEWVYVTRHV